MPFKLDPIKFCAVFLILFAALAFSYNASAQLAMHLAATVGFGLLTYVAFTEFLPNKHKNVWDTVITTLILFLVIHYGSTWVDLVFPLTATLFAMLLKFFVEFKGTPVVNPAAAGILISALVLAFIPGLEHPFVSWWGASYQGYLSLALMGLWMIFGLPSWKRGWAVLAFLTVFASGMLLRGEGLDSLRFAYTDAMIYFFATLMLMEPKTSPFKPTHQAAYGAVAAVLIHALMAVSAPYPELFGLVGANLFQTGLRHWPKKGTPAD